MNVARVAVLGVALGAGVIAAMLAVNMTGQGPAPIAEVEQPVIDAAEVLVAARDLPIGSTLSESDFAWEIWPRATTSPGLILRADQPEAMTDLSSTIARSPFFEGEPIRAAKLAQPGSGFMSAILPKGKRAVATAISADTSAGGFILPNDQVDVIMTRRLDGPNGEDRFDTETILRNVRVLAIDQTIEEQNGEPVVVGQTATLELTPRQAEILTAAQQMTERLTLALRSLADSAPSSLDGGDATHLLGAGRTGGGVTIVRNGVAVEVPATR